MSFDYEELSDGMRDDYYVGMKDKIILEQDKTIKKLWFNMGEFFFGLSSDVFSVYVGLFDSGSKFIENILPEDYVGPKTHIYVGMGFAAFGTGLILDVWRRLRKRKLELNIQKSNFNLLDLEREFENQ